MNRCTKCSRSDDDTELGWSLCNKCFHDDEFQGWVYWTPLWCLLLWLTAIIWLVAALIVLAA